MFRNNRHPKWYIAFRRNGNPKRAASRIPGRMDVMFLKMNLDRTLFPTSQSASVLDQDSWNNFTKNSFNKPHSSGAKSKIYVKSSHPPMQSDDPQILNPTEFPSDVQEEIERRHKENMKSGSASSPPQTYSSSDAPFLAKLPVNSLQKPEKPHQLKKSRKQTHRKKMRRSKKKDRTSTNVHSSENGDSYNRSFLSNKLRHKTFQRTKNSLTENTNLPRKVTRRRKTKERSRKRQNRIAKRVKSRPQVTRTLRKDVT